MTRATVVHFNLFYSPKAAALLPVTGVARPPVTALVVEVPDGVAIVVATAESAAATRSRTAAEATAATLLSWFATGTVLSLLVVLVVALRSWLARPSWWSWPLLLLLLLLLLWQLLLVLLTFNISQEYIKAARHFRNLKIINVIRWWDNTIIGS